MKKWTVILVIIVVSSPISGRSIEWNVEMLEANALYGIAGNVIVAVIDTGLDTNHPDFLGKIWVNDDEIPENGIDDDGNGYIDDVSGWDFQNNDNDVQDDSTEYHGTHVTGVIVSEEVGVSPNTTIMPLKAMDENGYADFGELSEAIRYAVNNGADIISMSFGGLEIDSSMMSAISYAKNNGVLMIAASGNEGSSSVHYPAKLDGVIAVGSINSKKERSLFSNFGQSIDLVAPGEVIRSTVKIGEGLDSSLIINSTSFSSIPMQYSNTTNSSSLKLVGGGKGLPNQLENIAGSIVLIERGSLTFSDMAINVKNNDGIGMIVYNNVDGLFAGTLGGYHNISVISVDKQTGLSLKNLINGTYLDIGLNITSGNYAWNSGTSMAVPHVTGVISLMKMRNPDLSNEIIERVLRYTSEDLGQQGHDPSYGYGLVNGEQINKVMNDIEKPDVIYNIWNEIENLSGEIEFELNVTVQDVVGLHELEFEYLDGNEIKRNSIIAERNESIQVSLGFKLPSSQNRLEITLRGSDVIGNIKELIIVFEREIRSSSNIDESSLTGVITIIETISNPVESDKTNINPVSIISGIIVIVLLGKSKKKKQ